MVAVCSADTADGDCVAIVELPTDAQIAAVF
jgi:hypothetical protein